MNSTDSQNLMITFEKFNQIASPSSITKQELLRQIEYADKIAHLFALGNCFYFLMNFNEMKFDYMSNSVFNVLGIDKEGVSLDSLLALWHPDDLKKMSKKEEIIFQFLYEHISPKDIVYYKVSYLNRLKSAEGFYKKILHQSTTIVLSEDEKIERTFCIETDLTHLNIPMSDTITFLGMNGRPSFYCDDMETIKPLQKKSIKLSDREIQIVNLVSKGFSSKKISETLNISVHTVNTHKKNILSKSNVENMVQLIAQCITEGIIYKFTEV